MAHRWPKSNPQTSGNGARVTTVRMRQRGGPSGSASFRPWPSTKAPGGRRPWAAAENGTGFCRSCRQRRGFMIARPAAVPALKSGPANLSCAIRIMARTVTRDGVIHARTPRWSGVSADWGPMRSPAKRQEMANWLRGQDYCQMQVSPRPVPRPTPEGLVMGPRRAPIRPEHRPPVIRLVGAEPRGDFETSDLANRSMDGPGPAVRVD